MYSSKEILLVFCFIAIWSGIILLVKLLYKNNIHGLNFILFASGIVGIIAYFI